MLLDRRDKARPSLHVSFEPVRSTLACIVIRNTSLTPATLKSLIFNDDFLDQLPKDTQRKLKKFENTTMSIFPGRLRVISFDIGTSKIIQDFEQKEVTIDITYSKLNKKRNYPTESIIIDFEDYSGILVYLSELDEFKQVTGKLTNNVKNMVKHLEKISTFKDDWEKYAACEMVQLKEKGKNQYLNFPRM